MSNSNSGDVDPERSTLFATDIVGSGASTTLTYVGSYLGLRNDLIAWDKANGNALGLASSAASGQDPKTSSGFNVEGLEFAPGSTTTAYLAFRAPLESTSTRTKALVVPITNIACAGDRREPGHDEGHLRHRRSRCRSAATASATSARTPTTST